MQSLFGHSSVQRQHAATLEGQTENDILADVLDGKMYTGNTVFTTKPDNTLSGCLFSYESFGFCQEKAQDFSYMHDPCRYIPPQ